MRERLHLIIPAVPVAQPRQRHTIIAGHVHNYTPADSPVNTFKATLRLAVQQAGFSAPLDGAVMLRAIFYLPRPKRLMRKCDPDEPVPHTSKPDDDNIEKATKDALRHLVWRDDCLIFDTHITKYYAEKDGQPRTEIWVYA